MKKCSPMIIFSLFCFLCTLNLSRGTQCSSFRCPRTESSSVLSRNISVQYPFYIKGVQPDSCGKPGFELYCDNTFGTIIKLPNNIVLQVYGLYLTRIMLSDPLDRCLAGKLLSLNLTNTPFYPYGRTKKFWLYNCSGTHDYFYDQIDCLSGSNHTVTSYKSDINRSVMDSKCGFIDTLTVSVPDSSWELSLLSVTFLTWDREGSKARYPLGVILGIMGGIIVGLCSLFGLRRFRKQRTAQATATINTTSTDSTPSNVEGHEGGLDQVTIDAYPVVVIGESGRFIKPDYESCLICLSEYRPHDTLKILPECLHRFHLDCIDPWLLLKGVCPICRTSPPIYSSSH